MTVIIGLTGSIASGKSTVSNMFKQVNIPVIDADIISREVVEPGEKAYEQIVQAFGQQILLEDGTIDRPKLGKVVFSSEEKRKTLNAIVHPEVRKKMLQLRDHYIKENEKAVVLDIPLLFESKLTHYVEKVLVVYVDEETQLKRLMERDQINKEHALEKIKSQIPVKEKKDMADAVIDNNGTVEQSYEQFINILKRWNIL
ncbi:dephospho-CoA kinase [Salirhabdus salicampi]|uniref:dephospho-CoA kinase n=1 Tax=Salirhabdus salicampi TaxID=476102 RepID=UPI0020C3CF77|nr:dephospho-CoA kinase [Salirhabdus salicampi]MCP8617084.1 dephospho-CoA kinase [Salirhabdus salicampi]